MTAENGNSAAVPKLINNVNIKLCDDLISVIAKGSRVSVAAGCFSIYAYKILKEQLENVEQLRFIFTSPTFTTEKAPKEKENSTYRGLTENAVCMVQSLKSNCATN